MSQSRSRSRSPRDDRSASRSPRDLDPQDEDGNRGGSPERRSSRAGGDEARQSSPPRDSGGGGPPGKKSNGHTVWVGGLPDRVHEDDIRTKFEKFGRILDVRLKTGGRGISYPFILTPFSSY